MYAKQIHSFVVGVVIKNTQNLYLLFTVIFNNMFNVCVYLFMIACIVIC